MRSRQRPTAQSRVSSQDLIVLEPLDRLLYVASGLIFDLLEAGDLDPGLVAQMT